MLNSNKQLQLGVLLSYIQMAVGIGITLLYTPIMIRILGQGEYGLLQTVISVVSTLSILSLGFNSSYVRYYIKYKVEKNLEAIYKLNGLFLIIFSVIALVAFLCGILITFNLEYIFSNGLTPEEYKIARVLTFLQTLDLTMMFITSVFTSIVSAHEKFIFLKLVGIFKNIATPLFSLLVLTLGYKSIAIVLVTLLISFVSNITYVYYVLVKMQEKFYFNNFEKNIFKNLFAYTFFIALNMIVDQVNLNLDKVILSRYNGTAAAAIYSVGFIINQMYQMFSSAIVGVFTPKVHTLIIEYSRDINLLRIKITDLFILVGRIQFLVLSLVVTGFTFFGREFITVYWVGSEYIDSYYVVLLLIIPSTIPLIQNLGIEIQRAENKHQFRSLIYFIMAIMNLFISVHLCKIYGAIGCAIGTAISFIFANGLVMNIYYYKECNIDIIKFWKSIFLMTKGLIIPIFTGVIIRKYMYLDNVLLFLFSIILYTIIYFISVWLLSMNSTEKNFICKPLRKYFNYL